MSINAMNTLHRRLPNEPTIVDTLVTESGQVPRWGADNEDSKTPIMTDLLSANQNLIGCFNRTIRFEDTDRVGCMPWQIPDSPNPSSGFRLGSPRWQPFDRWESTALTSGGFWHSPLPELGPS